MSKNNYWLISALTFTSGILLSFYFSIFSHLSLILYFIFSFIFFLIFLAKRKILFLLLAFFFLGVWRYQLVIGYDRVQYIENYLSEDFVVIGVVSNQVEVKEKSQKIELTVKSGRDMNGQSFLLKGKMLIYAPVFPLYNYGDILEIYGDYVAPSVLGDFNYPQYLKRFGIGTLSYYPEIYKVGEISGFNFSLLKKKIFALQKILLKKIEANLSWESAAIARAMFLGDKSFLDEEMKNNFSRSGLSHVIAISGMHISLLSSIFLELLLAVGISRKKSFYFCVIFLLFYLILIGAPASAIRASIMGFWSLLAIYLGRPGNIVRGLIISGFIMVLFNPLLLVSDVGFQLSFLAVLAIVFIHPIIKDFLQRKVWRRKGGEGIIDIFSITFSVQILSAPILISNFDQISLVAPLSNLLILFLLTPMMILFLLSLSCSFIIPPLAPIFYFFFDVLISYFLFIGRLSGAWSFSVINIYSWSRFLSLIYYLLIIIFLFKKNRDT